ncbi:serine/threonine-protein kinase fused [Anoplophora glabripennis]|uniref:serine/threonine-protein kinase fused n=1 Tax=Anoplophora glabripennis TaxID=217634 RepID=UPI0008743059|nr:serine/threonine-protein kinase fused [Anoplophora glabripennis]
MDKYEVIGTLGEGSFGRVYKAKQVSDSSLVALKVISKRGRSSKELKGFRRECEIQRDLHHPNIIQMLDSFETENEIVVITEFAHKELTAVLGKEGYLSEERVQPIVWDLVSALCYLHSNRVLHRDLKPQNILLDIKNRAKLCDFGFARNMSTGTHVLTSIKGTPLYMAPELIDEQPYDYNADLWSLGCIIYELLMGTPPFCTASILHLIRLIRHEQIQWPTFLSDNCTSFLKGLLQKNPTKRMTWDEILCHPFVKGHVTLSKNTTSMPLTRPLSANTLQLKEQQRKDSIKSKHNKAASSKSNECNEYAPEQKKSSASKNSKTSSQHSNNSTKRSNSQDIKNNNVEEHLQNLSLENKNKGFSSWETNKLDYSEQKKSGERKNLNKNETYKDSKANIDHVKQNCSEKETGEKSKMNKCFIEKLNFIEDNQPIETDEWIVFLQRTIQEVINGEMGTLIQPSQTNIIVSPLRNSNANSKVLTFVARLLSIPFVIKGTTEDTLTQIKKVYLDVKLVPNLVYASKLLLREYREHTPSEASSPGNSPLPSTAESYRGISELCTEDFQALEYMFLLISHLVHLDDHFMMQFCDAVVVLTSYVLMKLMLLLSKRRLRIVLDVMAILTHLLRQCPENGEIIEKILLKESNNPDVKQINFVDLLRHSNSILRERSSYFLLFIGKCLPESTMRVFWSDVLRDTLEALMYDSIETVRNAAEVAVSELKSKDYYIVVK